MKKTILTFLAITSILCVLPGCKTGETQKEMAEKYRLNEGLNGRSLTMLKGEYFSLRLKSNPTTGYSWKITSMDKSILELAENKYIQEKNKKNAVGVGGTDFFLFKAQGVGKTKLKINYIRSWEKYAKPTKTFTLEVTVEEAK
jgi:inhibitor of cysteine peptidase